VKVQGGSRHAKRPNRNIGRQDGARRIDRDYFCRRKEHAGLSACFTEADLERRYRGPRDVYERIRDKLILWHDKYFVERVDCCGVGGASADQKLWAAVRQLSYGVPADAVSEYGRLAESTNAQCLKKFCAAVVELFEEQWLRFPTMDDIREIEIRYRKLRFPGCIGCLDCASWEWEACPIGWQGLCKGKDSKPVLRSHQVEALLGRVKQQARTHHRRHCQGRGQTEHAPRVFRRHC
jgi:Plant transposon protein